jgi:dTDP-4-amino-4,6-dideoxygalactose transaminase
VAQLRKLKKIIKTKRRLAKLWDKKLNDISGISYPYVEKKAYHVYQNYVAILDKKIDRNKLIERLFNNGIQTHIGTYASHIQPVYSSSDKCPNSLKIFNQSLALPMYFTLNEDNIHKAVNILDRTLEEFR